MALTFWIKNHFSVKVNMVENVSEGIFTSVMYMSHRFLA